MKRPLISRDSRSHGFTLVEMLVVITIIGILASLITAAAVVARRRAKIAAVGIEVSQLDFALKAYKEKFGEYPPDFAGLYSQHTDVRTATRNSVLRHLARAFPRFQANGWSNLRTVVLTNWRIDLGDETNPPLVSPISALTFWLGGQPDWLIDNTNGDLVLPGGGTDKVLSTKPVRGFLGFSADPTNPFSANASRIGPFFEFDFTCLAYSKTSPGGITFWPTSACDRTGISPIVYFRANNGTYFEEGATTSVKFCGSNSTYVFAAADTRLSDFTVSPPTITWMNRSSFQIFTSGLDTTYGQLTYPFVPNMPSTDVTTNDPNNCLAFPSGDNYAEQTYDDITNFSGSRTLEDSIPP